MKPPKIPSPLVELGRAIELDGTDWIWTWNKRDNWIVASDKDGKRLYLYKKHRQIVNRNSKAIEKGDKLYTQFNRRYAQNQTIGTVRDVRHLAGLAIHVVYESDKFGPIRHYIHTFETRPKIWLDKPSEPSIIALTHGRIKITRRGIEG